MALDIRDRSSQYFRHMGLPATPRFFPPVFSLDKTVEKQVIEESPL